MRKYWLLLVAGVDSTVTIYLLKSYWWSCFTSIRWSWVV